MKPNRRLKEAGQAAGVFALGAAVGSILALLYAPASGKVTRKRIGNKVKQTQKLLAKKATNLREAATEKFGETREWLMERVSNGNGKHSTRKIVHHA